jgi:hypothetical protein
LRACGPPLYYSVMISHARSTTNLVRRVRAALALALVMAGLVACSDNNPAEPNDRLCNVDTGLGAEILGRSGPLEFCLDDGDVSVLLTTSNRYDISGQLSTSAGVFQIRMVFALRADAPVSLTPVSTVGEATASPDNVWIYYNEAPDGVDPIESAGVSGGSFRLTFSDDKVVTGTMKNVSFPMRDVSTGDPVGTRAISEGFFSLSVKSPAVALDRIAQSR